MSPRSPCPAAGRNASRRGVRLIWVDGLCLEADSWEWHTGKQAHVNDCWRYNALVIHGWALLRLAWEHVMLHPDYVRGSLITLLEGPPERTEVGDPLRWSA